MTSIIRENNNTGRVVGITVEAKGAKLNIRARKGVIIATGGHTSNVNFRRIFDPRLTEEYCGVAGEPYTTQDASGEIAGMEVGASLWGTANQTGEFGAHIAKPGYIGCQYGYPPFILRGNRPANISTWLAPSACRSGIIRMRSASTRSA
jgi:hypothetical protein